MVEALRKQTPESVRGFLDTAEERYQQHYRDMLRLAETSVPEIVADARRLASAIERDGLGELFLEDENPPVFRYLASLSDPETMLDDANDEELKQRVLDSPDRDFFREVYAKYYPEVVYRVKLTSKAENAQIAFSSVFDIVTEVARQTVAEEIPPDPAA